MSADRPLLVMKFGCHSLVDGEKVQAVFDSVVRHLPQRPVLVLGAIGDTTQILLDAAEKARDSGKAEMATIRGVHEELVKQLGISMPDSCVELLSELEQIMSGVALVREVSGRTRDLVSSFGERLSVRIFTAFFNSRGAVLEGQKLEAKALEPWDVGLVAAGKGGPLDSTEVVVKKEEIARFFQPLKSAYTYVPILPGNVTQDGGGAIITFGRDGVDLSAALVGAAVQAVEVQIWKAATSLLTIDPQMVPDAKPIRVLTYEEATELSTFGSEVVHPAAVIPVAEAGVPVCLRNLAAPSDPGTRIVSALTPSDVREGQVVAISSKRDITMIVLRSTRMLGQHGFLASMFQVMSKFQASVDVISTSEVTVSLTLDQESQAIDLAGMRTELERIASVEIREDMAMLTLIMDKNDSTSVLRDAFTAFAEESVLVEMVSHGASNVNVTFVFQQQSLLRCAQRLHRVFFGV